MNTATANKYPRAAILAKYVGPTNTKGARICVSSQHTMGRKFYPYHDLSEGTEGSAYAAAVGLYLADMLKESRKQYGDNASNWGELSDFAHGVLASGEHVFVSLTK
jgi:hypothetical protein